MLMVKELREKYFIFCSIVVYPVVPKGIILLRLIPTSSHNINDIEETDKELEAFNIDELDILDNQEINDDYKSTIQYLANLSLVLII